MVKIFFAYFTWSFTMWKFKLLKFILQKFYANPTCKQLSMSETHSLYQISSLLWSRFPGEVFVDMTSKEKWMTNLIDKCNIIVGNFQWCKYLHKSLPGFRRNFGVLILHVCTCICHFDLLHVFMESFFSEANRERRVYWLLVNAKLPCQCEDGNRVNPFTVP